MTALSNRGLEQTPAGLGFEVWRQTLLEPLSGVTVANPDWITRFHGGTVEMPLLQAGHVDTYAWPSQFGCAIFPASWESESPRISDSNYPLSILTALYYRDTARTRQAAEADVYDAIYYLAAAAMSQRLLTWKASWATPAPAHIASGFDYAVKRLPTDPVFFDNFDTKGGCATVAFLEVAWEIAIAVC